MPEKKLKVMFLYQKDKISLILHLWLIKNHSQLKDSQIARLIGITKNSVTSVRNKSHWNYNSLNAKDPVAIGLITQKELVDAIEKAERRIKREKKKRKGKSS